MRNNHKYLLAGVTNMLVFLVCIALVQVYFGEFTAVGGAFMGAGYLSMDRIIEYHFTKEANK